MIQKKSLCSKIVVMILVIVLTASMCILVGCGKSSGSTKSTLYEVYEEPAVGVYDSYRDITPIYSHIKNISDTDIVVQVMITDSDGYRYSSGFVRIPIGESKTIKQNIDGKYAGTSSLKFEYMAEKYNY